LEGKDRVVERFAAAEAKERRARPADIVRCRNARRGGGVRVVVGKLPLFVPLALVAAACSTAVSGLAPPSATPHAGAAAGDERSTVLGLLWNGERTGLARLDARTLRRLGPRIDVGGGGTQAFSPDGQTLVVSSAVVSGPSAGSGRSELSLVDLRTLRRIGRRLELAVSGLASRILWSNRGQFVVLLDDPPRIVTVRSRPLRVTAAQALGGRIVATDANARRLVVLLAPSRSIGPSRLAVVEADGRVRATTLAEVSSGWEPVELADHPGTRQRIPGLALSREGGRVVVVPAGDRVAEVDLDSLRVSYRELSESVSLLQRLRRWLEPEAGAKTVAGYDRFARWLGEDHVAVTGTSYEELDAAASGLRLIDTRDWSVRTLVKNASGMVVVRDLVLAFSWAGTGRDEGIGLRGYDAEGEERFHLFGREFVDWVETAWPYAYVPRGGGRRFDVVDLRSGRVVARANPRAPVSIVGP
jgi:hypothetical protein